MYRVYYKNISVYLAPITLDLDQALNWHPAQPALTFDAHTPQRPVHFDMSEMRVALSAATLELPKAMAIVSGVLRTAPRSIDSDR